MTEDEMKKMAQDMTKLAFDTLVEVMTLDSNAPEARVAAAKEVLRRGWGPLPE